MPFDLSQVNWIYVILYAVFAFVASIVGNSLTFNNRLVGGLFTAALFAAMYVGWHYYPHHLAIGIPVELPGGVTKP